MFAIGFEIEAASKRSGSLRIALRAVAPADGEVVWIPSLGVIPFSLRKIAVSMKSVTCLTHLSLEPCSHHWWERNLDPQMKGKASTIPLSIRHEERGWNLRESSMIVS